MKSDIYFDPTYNINGTYHIGYFYVQRDRYKWYQREMPSHFDEIPYYPHLWRNNQMLFQQIVGRLYHAADYDIFEETHRDVQKLSFQIIGMYKGKIFTYTIIKVMG